MAADHKSWIFDSDLVNEVDANDDLDKVISDDGLFQIHGLTIAHQPRSQRLDEVDVACANSQRIERRTHQKPAISSFICPIIKKQTLKWEAISEQKPQNWDGYATLLLARYSQLTLQLISSSCSIHVSFLSCSVIPGWSFPKAQIWVIVV